MTFVNAKINIGLDIVARREDGYHELNTVFYPVGLHAGQPENPVPFCDILEVTPMPVGKPNEVFYEFYGNPVGCTLDKNLVARAANAFCNSLPEPVDALRIALEKHIPDQAGMGGGSADAAFTLMLLNEYLGQPKTEEELLEMALKLGADCPFFIKNTPCYAEGVGEKLEEIPLDLSGYWLAIAKPALCISTKEAFAGVTPRRPEIPLREAIMRPIAEWNDCIRNQFEESLFPNHPELRELKEGMYRSGALYASMTGSGSVVYGIFPTREAAEKAVAENPAAYSNVLLL